MKSSVWNSPANTQPHSEIWLISGGLQTPCKGRFSSQAPLCGLGGPTLAAGHCGGNRGARPCSASWPQRACGDFGLGPEPSEGRGRCGGKNKAATRECRSGVRNFLTSLETDA